MKSTDSTVQAQQNNPEKRSRKISEKPPRPFPNYSLEDALVVPDVIKKFNGGNPWTPEEVAKALDRGPKAPEFYYITAASRDYGLTVGTRGSKQISLTPLGESIMYTGDPSEEILKKQEAFFKVDIFKKIFEHYKNGVLPELKYLANTLEKEFRLHPDYHKDFVKIYTANCNFTSISTRSNHGLTNGATIPSGAKPDKHKHGQIHGQKIFVALPFSEKSEKRASGFFSEVLESLIKPAGESAGFVVETASKHGSDVIQSTILTKVIDADLMLVDLTDHNPNVLFELGLRIALDKPVVIIKAAGTGGIFDVDNMIRYYEYDPNLWPSTLKKDLPKLAEHIKAAWDERGENLSYMKILTRREKN